MIQNRKGITPIISVILLLMMTIAIAGLAYTWLQRTQSTIQTSSENITETMLGGLKVQLKIEGYRLECDSNNPNQSNLSISVRNAGTSKARNLQLYIDGSLQAGMSNTSLSAGQITNFKFINPTNPINCSNFVNKSRTIKITSDETVAEKTYTFTCTSGSC